MVVPVVIFIESKGLIEPSLMDEAASIAQE